MVDCVVEVDFYGAVNFGGGEGVGLWEVGCEDQEEVGDGFGVGLSGGVEGEELEEHGDEGPGFVVFEIDVVCCVGGGFEFVSGVRSVDASDVVIRWGRGFVVVLGGDRKRLCGWWIISLGGLNRHAIRGDGLSNLYW
jgi:hypothetical protein